MDFCPGLLISERLFISSLFENLYFDQEDKYTCIYPSVHPLLNQNCKVWDLFYNGRWQIPIHESYWKHKDTLYANATRKDIEKCIESATKGFQTWKSMSTMSKWQTLSKFKSALDSNGQFQFANEVSKWITLPVLGENSTYCVRTEKYEISRISKPKGTIILKETDGCTLFRKLTQILITGNSVIVVCDPDLNILAPLCNIFKVAGIPPGVINLLFCENIGNIQYNDFTDSLNNIYSNLRTNQYIVVSHN